MKDKSQYLILFIITIILTAIGIKPIIIFAQTEAINPLEIKEKDVLLPSRERPLRDFEIKRLREKLNELNAEAKKEFTLGNIDQAFAIWYRELRLKRVLGTVEEIKGLIELGKIAWDKTRNQDIKYITERLVIIETENTSKNGEIKEELMPLFAEAYETLHDLDKSIAVYQQILKLARQKNDQKNIILALDKLGQFYLAKFNYYQAEPIYKELLALVRQEQNYLQEGIYLRKLAEIEGEIVKPENSINYKKELAENYLVNKNLQALADLKIAIGDDYKTLNQPEEANKYYQEAFALAWSLQQYATAGNALKKLGRLYQDYEQNEYALQIYQELIKIEQQSYNLYGLMNTYDLIGQIYVKEKNYSLALQWVEKAKEIANHLKYKVDYFNAQIQQINEQQQKTNN